VTRNDEETCHKKGLPLRLSLDMQVLTLSNPIARILAISLVVASLLLAAGGRTAVGMQEPWHTDVSKHSPAEAAIAEQKWQEIEAELIATSRSEWAGEYDCADNGTDGALMIWAPTSGFVVQWVGCYPGVHDVNYGSVVVADGRIQLGEELPVRKIRSNAISEELIFVRWDTCHYLVPSDRMLEFCNAVNGGGGDEANVGVRGFLSKLGESRLESKGLPEVPAEYTKYLLRRPVRARISHVGEIRSESDPNNPDRKRRIVEVTVDSGDRKGLQPGMWLYLHSPLEFGLVERLEITSVAPASCRVVLELDHDGEAPRVGWRVSTRFAG
jgi:hypothetical protein